MRILLDTHALLWFQRGDPRLGPAAKERISDGDNDVLVSVASLWEIQIKASIGKLRADLPEIVSAMQEQGIDALPVTPAHLFALRGLPRREGHKDPWDHLLIAQAVSEAAVFMSGDRHVPAYPVTFMTCGGNGMPMRGGA